MSKINKAVADYGTALKRCKAAREKFDALQVQTREAQREIRDADGDVVTLRAALDMVIEEEAGA